jgi:hypothetical protein
MKWRGQPLSPFLTNFSGLLQFSGYGQCLQIVRHSVEEVLEGVMEENEQSDILKFSQLKLDLLWKNFRDIFL